METAGLVSAVSGLLVVLVLSGTAGAARVEVSPDGMSLADAVASADAGDTLFLRAGTYAGPVSISRSMTLEGENGAVIDGGGAGSVVIVTAPDVTVRGLIVRGSGTSLFEQDSGIFVTETAHRAVIANNTLERNLIGVYLHGPENAVVRNNEIVGRQDLRVNERGNGIQLWNTPGSRVVGNTVRYGRDGIFVTTSKHNLFSDNTFRSLRFAIHYMYTDDSELSGNRSYGNHVGYAIMYSHRLQVHGNLSTGDRDHGIMLNYANESHIEGNVVRDGGTKCVFIYNANKNTFERNWFEGCQIGVHFTAGSERNTLSRNAFIDNRTQVKYVGTRSLDWSKNGRGNYWSDHPGFDLNGDGIADKTYRPNDLVDQIVWRRPLAKLLLNAPAVQILRWAQAQLPALHPGGVVDTRPLMRPPRIELAESAESDS